MSTLVSYGDFKVNVFAACWPVLIHIQERGFSLSKPFHLLVFCKFKPAQGPKVVFNFLSSLGLVLAC